MAQMTQEQYKALREKGLSDSTIQSLAQSKGIALPEENTGVLGFATGALKTGGEIVKGLGDVMTQGAINQGLGPVSKIPGVNDLLTQPLKAEQEAVGLTDENLESKSTAEKAGKIAANVALFFVPGAKATQVAGRASSAIGQVISRIGLRLTSKEAPLVQAYRARFTLPKRISAALSGKTLPRTPTTGAETALNQNLFGTKGMIGVQARRAADNIWKQVIQPALTKSKTRVKMTQFVDDVQAEVNKVVDPSRKRQLQTALDAFKEDFKDVGTITMEQLQRYKEGWAEFVPDKVYKGKPISAAFREIQNIAAGLARNTIYKELGTEVKAAYFDYGNLIGLQKLGQKALTQEGLQAGSGKLISSILDTALVPITSVGGLTLYRVGKAFEFVGTQGLKTVKQIFGL